ncbi:MAG: hypothetical protein EOO14_02790 [Chitinophagaceae bacterium]|nr:MAG: hypothetical protein EOO14_02790 [Chitinophagaceae bacterium]
MSKFLLAILLCFATVAVVAHGVLVYQVNAAVQMIAEEETHDHQSSGKEAKDLKEKISFPPEFYKYAFVKKLHVAALNKAAACSKGFYDKPYNPPDAS